MELAADDIWVGDRLFVDIRDEGVELQQLLLAGLQSMFGDMPNGRAEAIVDCFISDLAAERHEAHSQSTAASLLGQDRALFEMHPEAKASLAEISRYLTRRLRNDFHGACPAMELVERSCAKQ